MCCRRTVHPPRGLDMAEEGPAEQGVGRREQPGQRHVSQCCLQRRSASRGMPGSVALTPAGAPHNNLVHLGCVQEYHTAGRIFYVIIMLYYIIKGHEGGILSTNSKSMLQTHAKHFRALQACTWHAVCYENWPY